MKRKIETPNAPKPLGPYSQAVVVSAAQELIFVSGQLPIDPQTGNLITGDMKALTHQIIKNIEAILVAAESSLQNVVKTEVFLKDMKDFSLMNEVYNQYFTGPVFPARYTIQAAALPLGTLIEISCIATK